MPEFIYINGLPVLKDISGSMNPKETTGELVALVNVLAAKLEGKTVVIPKRAGDEKRLFGSVTSSDIAAALEGTGIAIDRKIIVLPEPIKALGEYRVQVRTGYQTTAQLLVQVVPEEAVNQEGN